MKKVQYYDKDKNKVSRLGLDDHSNMSRKKHTYLSYDLKAVSILLSKSGNEPQDVVMADINASEEVKLDRNWCILDIKQLTNKLSSAKILKLINQEFEIENNSEINPFKLEDELDKQSLNQWSDL